MLVASGAVAILVEQGRLRRETSERRGDGVELDLFDLEAAAILMNHVIGPEEPERKVLRRRRLSARIQPLGQAGDGSRTWT
jgi:hypothetical protein